MRRTRRSLRFALPLLALAALALAGCAQKKREVYADYVLPPKAVADVSAIEVLDIDKPLLSLTGRYPAKPEAVEAVFSHAIVERLEGRLYANGFIRATDDIYADEDGLAQVGGLILDSKHGYDVKPALAVDKANLSTSAKISLVRSTGTDTVQTQLVTQPYTVDRDDDGKPYSYPDSSRRQVRLVTSRVPFVEVKAKGEMTVVLRDVSGKVVYNRRFGDLEFESKAGGKAGPGAEPTLLEVAQGLFNEALAQVVKDISPHRESRALVVNPKGDAKAVALMKATAFSEAHSRLAEVIEANEKKFDAASAEIDAEYAPRLTNAATNQDIAAIEADRLEALGDAARFLSPDYENMAILTEIIGDRGEALFLYEMAVETDPDNATAVDSLARVKELVGATSEVDAEKRANRFQQKMHKER